MTRRRPRVRVVLTVLLPLLVAACVYPVPPPGDPIPALTLTTSSPGAGVVTVTATPVNFTPDRVDFRLDGWLGAPVHTDTQAPFEVTLSTADHGAGTRLLTALGHGGGYFVGQQTNVELRRPNFVFVLLDDLDAWATPYWEAMPQTRAAIADRGLTFQNAFVVDPVCCPSRATFLTGNYPHNTNVYSNTWPDGGYTAFRDGGAQNDTIATRLHAQGYRTAFLGKYLNGYENYGGTSVPPGWDEWYAYTGWFFDGYNYSAVHNGTIESYGSAPEDYQTDVLANRATQFVDAAEANDAQPFFMAVHTLAPHENIPPAPRHLPNPYASATIPQRPNFNEADVSDKATWLRDGFPLPTQAEMDTVTDNYRRAAGSLLAVDDLVANLTAKLQADGELDDTVIVFGSDNGLNLLSHRLFAKMSPYDESTTVPLVMAGPGIRTGTETRMVTNTDLAPTLLQLAGAGPQTDLDGRSLVPLLRGESPSWRSDFLVELNGSWFFQRLHTFADVQNAIAEQGRIYFVPTYRAVRTKYWLYVEWYWGEPHEYELYNLTTDPYMLDNLLATPAGETSYAFIRTVLQTRLDALKACRGPTCRT